MTREEFISKWANHLTGKVFTFAYGQDSRLHARNLVNDIERACISMLVDAQSVPGPVAQPAATNGVKAK